MTARYAKVVLLASVSIFVSWGQAIAQVAVPGTTPGVPVPGQLPRSNLIYGYSVQGRPLAATILGNGPNVTFILGGIHGNETSSPPVVELLTTYLENHPELLVGCKVVLVAHVNPDGDVAHTRGNANDVDLNRNFPFHWMPPRRGISLSPGSSALSEPEARGLVQLLHMYHPRKIVSIHQPLDCLLPSGPGGDALASAMHACNGYIIKKGGVGYPTPGSFGSYCNHVLGIAGTTLEMPWENEQNAWRQNREALIVAIQLTLPPVKDNAPLSKR
jgi:murein peptide amidase A